MRGGKGGETVLLHQVCHTTIHKTLSETDLARNYATVEALRGAGKTLELLDLEKPGPFDKLIAENELLDPEHSEGFLEPLQQRGLRKRWREGRERIAKRLARRRATSR